MSVSIWDVAGHVWPVAGVTALAVPAGVGDTACLAVRRRTADGGFSVALCPPLLYCFTAGRGGPCCCCCWWSYVDFA